MAQHDYVIDNQASAAARSDLNNLFQAIVTQNSGDTAPATTYANMIWYETDTNTLWKRNEANSGWISMGTFDESALTFTPSGTPAIATQAEAEAGSNNTKMMTPLRTSQAITALGGGMVLLGTINTTSGSSQSLSSLTLTNYRYLRFDFNGVATSGGGGADRKVGGISVATASSSAAYGQVFVSLASGRTWGGVAADGVNPLIYIGNTTYSTATTSVTVSTGNTFSAGSVRVYGVK